MLCLVVEKKKDALWSSTSKYDISKVTYVCILYMYHHISHIQVHMYASISNHLHCYHQYGSDHFQNFFVFAYTLMDFNNGFVLVLFFLILNLPNLEQWRKIENMKILDLWSSKSFMASAKITYVLHFTHKYNWHRHTKLQLCCI